MFRDYVKRTRTNIKNRSERRCDRVLVMMIVLAFISQLKKRRARRLGILTEPSVIPTLFPWVGEGTYELRRPRLRRCDRVLVMMMVLVFILRLKERRRLVIRTGHPATLTLFQRAGGGTHEPRGLRYVLERARKVLHRQHIRELMVYPGVLWLCAY